MTQPQPDELPTIDARIRDWGLTLTVVRSYFGEPEAHSRNRTFTTVHEVEVRMAGRARPLSRFPIHMGSGHAGRPPALWEVLEMYVDDARDGGQSFEEFIGHFVPEAERERSVVAHYRRVHRRCVSLRTGMRVLFGKSRLELLLHETDFS